jgi:two-component system, NarL family, nitrate/nitrite response regulator NarL
VPNRVAILIVADVRLYRHGLAEMLGRTPDISVAGTAATAAEGLRLAEHLVPDVVLLDTGASGALASVPRFRRLSRPPQIVALAVPDSDATVIACAEGGVAGYLTREASLDEVVTGVWSAARGEMHCPPQVAAALARRVRAVAPSPNGRDAVDCLTPRETEVLGLVEAGLSNQQIASELRIELPTVKHHVHNILEKLSVSRRGEAAALARRR